MLDPARSFDIIGDVHGCALTLERLLDALGYKRVAGVWRHPRRQAGDKFVSTHFSDFSNTFNG